ncbi:DUF3572 domain-containing protein [Pseudoprimorskyibacter insulae]|uniref:DUF3572 domain-containing protein n=1 Tax=Pseudoprimorskyibacter insulae TaxID=1695997 RepID=A0A2R8APS9_9RHOB|nr:DUF3572 domain-containing protein [Pseudoprimorskyibacter insulae]SPF78086.1 hypothetical protein PRI8871_00676 [Pseudoprimorskyibacter insulae]
MAISQTAAETIGLQAISWLVGNDELLPIFLGSTGASLDDIREGVADPAMQGAVLDFLLMDDAWLTGFADANGCAYEDVMQARMHLPGGEQVHWT